MKRILVTGATGFVGRHALSALKAICDPSDRIVGIARDVSSVPLAAPVYAIDLLDTVALNRFVEHFQPTHILHLAAMSSVKDSGVAPFDAWRVNLTGLLNLAQAVVGEAAAQQFLYVSSGEVYGRAFLGNKPVTEDVGAEPVGTYAHSKLFGEYILRDVLSATGVRLVILRPFNHIGPGQDERFVVASFAGQIARIEAGLVRPVLEVGSLAAQRDFLGVGDVVRAYVEIIARGHSIANNSVFNIASGKPRSIQSVLDGLRSFSNVEFEVKIAQDRIRPVDIPIAAGDFSRLALAVGWRPSETWESVIWSVLADARSKVARGEF